MQAKKSFGQHFLVDKHVLERIAALVDGDRVIEVGPGTGALTEYLATKPYLTLLEADRDLVAALAERFPTAHIERVDAARADFDAFTEGEPWDFVGNLPYNAAAAIVNQAMAAKNPPTQLVIMVQKEQADRMRAKPGEMGLLSIVVQFGYTIKKAFDVSPEAFRPKPRVDSTVLVFTHDPSAQAWNERESVIALAKAGFRARRKQLHRNLADAGVANSEAVKLALSRIGLREDIRAQELSVQNWINLRKAL